MICDQTFADKDLQVTESMCDYSRVRVRYELAPKPTSS